MGTRTTLNLSTRDQRVFGDLQESLAWAKKNHRDNYRENVRDRLRYYIWGAFDIVIDSDEEIDRVLGLFAEDTPREVEVVF